MVVTPKAIANGDAAAWLTPLFEANVEAVFNVACRITWNRDDAYDVIQETFVKAWLRRHQLIDFTRARGWVLSIAYREALAVLRKRTDIPTDPALLPERGYQDDPGDHLINDDVARMLHAAINELPVLLRSAVILRDVEELPIAEVATVLGIGQSAAKMRVARAREQLRITLTGRI
jgi:RNA polymerase sigma factor (sigma-70 family)